jgi:glyoxylase-like metal-dependent hydrolase (beta-lactamase superfamily II)
MRDPRQVDVAPISHPRGCRTYVVVDPASRDAAVIDPLLDHVKEILDAVSARSGTVRYVVDTHSHGDHLSGAAALKERLGCDVVMHPDAPSDVATLRPRDGEVLPFGDLGLKVWHTPGNSNDAIVIEAAGALFTGDLLLIGSMGLKDAPGGDPRRHFDTLRHLFEGRPETTVIHPGHDDMGRHTSTLKAERRGNRWLREEDYEVFRQRWETDPRRVAKEAPDFLEANRIGVMRPPKHLESALGYLDAARATEARIKGETRIEGAAEQVEAPRPALQTGLSALMTVLGLGCVLGWVLGTLLLPALHAVSLVCGIVLLGLGLSSGARRRGKGKGEELYYLGPSKHSKSP